MHIVELARLAFIPTFGKLFDGKLFDQFRDSVTILDG